MGKHRVCYFYDGVNHAHLPLPLYQLPSYCHSPSVLDFSFTTELCRSTDEVSGLYYGPKHPMKPHRITMTHHLVVAYDLHNHFDMYVRFPLLKSN